MLRQIHNIDVGFSRLFIGVPLPATLSTALKVFVRLGDGWLWLPVFMAIFLTEPLEEFRAIIGHALAALALSLSLYWPIKRSVRRRRPFELPGFAGTVAALDRFSFPSGHIMNNLAIGLTVAHYFPAGWLGLAGVPVVLGLLRIYFGVHFLSDVVVGGILGLLSFACSAWMFPLW